jgi:hypothetical protein
MKKLLLSCLGICLFSSVSFAWVDQKCMSGCLADGYSSWQCEKVCEKENPFKQTMPKQYDLKCFNDCTRAGYSWGYCKDQCSYGD